MNVAFVHPELGLGGAERLVVDAALELAHRGHGVTIFTAAHDPARAFPETRELDVRVRGGFLPRRIAGRGQALCTNARSSWAAAALATGAERFDVVVLDVVVWPIPVVRALDRRRPRIVYYCHYPDQLLAPAGGRLYRLYRAALDRLELPAMRAADAIVVNSRFTADALARLGGTAEVVYPGVDVARYAGLAELAGDEDTILVVSRFDERKNLPLAVEMMAQLRARAPEAFARLRLVIAGGFDPARPASVELVGDLRARVQALDLDGKVELCFSPPDSERLALLARSLCVVHTALGEHFGIVPIEAMAAARPVIAAADAGPLETVVDGETGRLVPPTPAAFAGALAELAADRARAARIGRAGRAHVAARFSRRAFGDAFEGVLERVLAPS
jgi:alpha-1,3/alpha-1,6-mannosyltransferase